MGILGILLDDDVEISDCLLMLLYHLVGLGSLMDIPQIGRDFLDAARVWVD